MNNKVLIVFLLIVLAVIPMLQTVDAFATVAANDDYTVTYKAGETYSCDYVIAYNPSYTVADNKISSVTASRNVAGNYMKTEQTKNNKASFSQAAVNERLSSDSALNTYTTGSTKVFSIYADVRDHSAGKIDVSFKCLAAGNYCYVWTPVSGYFPLDTYSKSYAKTIQEHFDANYTKMTEVFGMPYIPTLDGKIDLLYYDIQDGATKMSNTFVSGLFKYNDLYENDSAMISIDTYPSFDLNGVDNSLSTIYHEFQHLINYSQSVVFGRKAEMELWLNECMSLAAEELIVPGSTDYLKTSVWGDEYDNEYFAGKSLYDFDGDIDCYSAAALFASYITAQTGSYKIFGDIIDCYSSDKQITVDTAFTKAMQGTVFSGMTLSDVNLLFRAALVANSDEGVFGFRGNDAPKLALINEIMSSKSVSVAGGGAVVYAAEDGRFTVPQNDDMVYVMIRDGKIICGQAKATDVIVTYTDWDGVILAKVAVERGECANYVATMPVYEGYCFTEWSKNTTSVYYNTTVAAIYDYSIQTVSNG